jgi:hypothetical protein
LNGRGDRSRACAAGWLAPTFGDVEDELQWSADNEIRLRGAARYVEGQHGVGSVWRALQQSDGELGRWLGF